MVARPGAAVGVGAALANKEFNEQPGHAPLRRRATNLSVSMVRRSNPEISQSIKEKVGSLSQEDVAKVSNFQRAVRKRVLYGGRLHCKNLAERLLFEAHIIRGTARLFNQILVFSLFVAALRVSTNEEQQRGIFKSLDATYQFSKLRNISSREQFVATGMKEISLKSKQYFVLSSQYFQDQFGVGSSQIIGDMRSFTEPQLGSPLPLKVKQFSFTAWVRRDQQFLQGYILRKRVTDKEPNSQFSCWGWYLRSESGPELHYGAHDFFPVNDGIQDQVVVKLTTPRPFPADEYAMLTMVVTEHNVTFYHNLDLVETLPLRIPVTDCQNDKEGLYLGEAGLELGVVRFTPKVMSDNSIAEVISTGQTLQDVSTGSEPRGVAEEEIAMVGRTLSSSISGVDESVDQTKPFTEVGQILNWVQREYTVPSRPPAAPLGMQGVNSSTVFDSLNQRPYYSLLLGPYRLSQTYEDSHHRSLNNLPAWAGTGSTWTFWYRHFPCQYDTCGVYLYTARGAQEQMCWSFWVENNAIWFDFPAGYSPPENYPHNFVAEKHEINGDQNWRHLAIVLDETTDFFKFYMDGELAWSGAYGGSVANSFDECRAEYLTLGRAGPEFTYGEEVELYDFRQYVHPNGQPLGDQEIAALATAPTPGLEDDTKCLPPGSTFLRDFEYLDEWGHPCTWYYEYRVEFPRICDYPPARANCPIACQSRQECFTRTEAPKIYHTWNSIQKIDGMTRNGTMCLNDQETKEEMVQKCRTWVANGGSSEDAEAIPWANSMNTSGGLGRTGRRLVVTDCDELEQSIDEFCTFNSTAVTMFTEDLQANKGDFTIAFWIKPLGLTSLHTDGKFYPHVQFFTSISPPTHQLSLGLWRNPNGESRHFSTCGSGVRDIFENVEMKKASDDDWTFIAIVRRNMTERQLEGTNNTEVRGSWLLATNEHENFEASAMSDCLYDPSSFFSYLEVNYPALISPIMMIPEALPFYAVQEKYLAQRVAMSFRSGPLESVRKRSLEGVIPLHKEDYFPRSAMMAPPILFQTRQFPTADCELAYSRAFVQEQFAKVKETRCASPFSCDSETLSPEHVFACPGKDMVEPRAFDLDPLDFNGAVGYADFLQSVTDSPFLFRDNKVTPTHEIVDSSTKLCQIVLIFYTPKFGVTSVLTITADFAGAEAAKVEVALSHWQILEGTHLIFYLLVQSVVLINMVLMMMDLYFNLKIVLSDCREEGRWPTQKEVFKPFLDISVVAMIVAYISIKIPLIRNSANVTEDIQGRLSRIDWESKNSTVTQKKRQFFEEAKLLIQLMGDDAEYSVFANIILIVNLLRIIQCTSVHPRLALLTSTIQKALDDLWHAALLILLLTGCFAAIGTWQFGNYRDDFGSFTRTMQTQFEMMFGEFPPSWTESGGLQVYTVFYFLVVFLLVQNFLLAIIVETYMGVRQDNEDLLTEQEFVHDVFSSFLSYIRIWSFGWPSQRKLGKTLDKWTSRYSVGFLDLKRTGLFKDDVAIGKFILHYGKYDFTATAKIENFPPSKTGEEIIDKIERRLGSMLGRAPLTLKQIAFQAITHREDRKREKESVDGSRQSSMRQEPEVKSTPKSTPKFVDDFERTSSAAGYGNTNGYTGVGVDDLYRENQDLRAELRTLKTMFQQVLSSQNQQTTQMREMSAQMRSIKKNTDSKSESPPREENCEPVEGAVTGASLVFKDPGELGNGVNGRHAGTNGSSLSVLDSPKPPAIFFQQEFLDSLREEQKLVPLSRGVERRNVSGNFNFTNLRFGGSEER